jgi:hypothetical protein
MSCGPGRYWDHVRGSAMSKLFSEWYPDVICPFQSTFSQAEKCLLIPHWTWPLMSPILKFSVKPKKNMHNYWTGYKPCNPVFPFPNTVLRRATLCSYVSIKICSSGHSGWHLSSQLVGRQRLGRSQFEPSMAKSRWAPISINKSLGVVVSACHPSYAGSVSRRAVVQAGRGIHVRSYMKNT